jgi:tripartite-type tricarboxylate transporter receptor subunit TctC
VKKKLEASSYDVSANSPAEFADLIKTEVAQWQRVIEETKIPKVQ